MRDAELLLRYFAYQNFASSYQGNLKKFLDSTHRYFNSQWDSENIKALRQFETFNQTLILTRQIFGEKKYLRKWNGNSFEPRINRAVFDIMMYYFSDSNIASKASIESEKIINAFIKLCENKDFISSLETTTKSLVANRIRFSMWAEALNRELGTDIKSPFD
tara:strand:+ start:15526 stop:16011 length:486 start_codon:yes stop_codon:yes gene_type:complete